MSLLHNNYLYNSTRTSIPKQKDRILDNIILLFRQITIVIMTKNCLNLLKNFKNSIIYCKIENVNLIYQSILRCLMV